MTEEKEHQVVCRNRRARHNYHIVEVIEAGLALTGSEVKSLREGAAQIGEAYGQFERGELYLRGAHISHYAQANRENHPLERERKLLLRRGELRKLQGRVQDKGMTLIPLEIYFKGSWAKVALALARGKRDYDRRHDIAERETQRDLQRALRHARR